MKPAPFTYHAPTTVDEAVGLLTEHGDDAKLLAGGQSLVPLLNLRLSRFEHLIDLNRVAELNGIRCDDGHLEIRAVTRQARLETSAEVRAAVPLLAMATPLIGHFQIRNRGTVGGSIAHADPASEYPTIAVTLDAEMEVVGPTGRRTVHAADFFQATWTTVLDADEVLTAVRFPQWSKRAGFAIEEITRRHGDFAIAGAVVGIQTSSAGVISRAALGLLGVSSVPWRATEAERLLDGRSLDQVDVEEVGRAATAALDPTDDFHASAAYRRAIVPDLVAKAVRQAMKGVSR